MVEVHLLAAVAEELLQQEDLLVLQQADQVELEELYLLADHLKLHQVVAVEEGIQALELLDQVVVVEAEEQVDKLQTHKPDKLTLAVVVVAVAQMLPFQEVKLEVVVK